MMLPLSIWAPFGKEAWDTGRKAIESGAFVFVHTPEDRAFIDLKLYGSKQARRALVRLCNAHPLTPAHQVQLTHMYIHAFVNGALDQILSAQQPPSW
ncbi:hypothetical protein [Dictyobacter arantiisoli]|uniref:Uncharacterized protein n=1 Tax=Dictyobacter arantiisoli TaxID=2014874 RepID=A0A5A5TBI2_9CHLR|nr:hypothetical protein [Dictyobacter arantiisoli]GCF08717.1 hypothetical protein KDI_22810 [Dictyobacter arantiisoli]